MRLDFNYVVIDDDFLDDDDREDIDALIEKINRKLEEKGFEAFPQEFASKEDFEEQFEKDKLTTKRIDLYLSDNNLGNNSRIQELQHSNDGIEIYLELKKQFICDFVLYTRSSTAEIIERMAEYLRQHNYPGLFSRFTFVPRKDNDKWHNDVLELIDHILTKREEMNNLRGLFAEKISRIDLHLKKILKRHDDEKLWQTIDSIPDKYFQNSKITKAFLHNLRVIRNALLHNDEEYDTLKKEYKITCELENHKGKKSGGIRTIYESEIVKYRKQLIEVYKEVLSWE